MPQKSSEKPGNFFYKKLALSKMLREYSISIRDRNQKLSTQRNEAPFPYPELVLVIISFKHADDMLVFTLTENINFHHKIIQFTLVFHLNDFSGRKRSIIFVLCLRTKINQQLKYISLHE